MLFRSLPNIMKAKRKPLDVIELDNMGLALKKHIEVIQVTAPAARSAGKKVSSIDELINELQNQAKVL